MVLSRMVLAGFALAAVPAMATSCPPNPGPAVLSVDFAHGHILNGGGTGSQALAAPLSLVDCQVIKLTFNFANGVHAIVDDIWRIEIELNNGPGPKPARGIPAQWTFLGTSSNFVSWELDRGAYMNLSRLGLAADWQDNAGTGDGKPGSFRGVDIWVPIADDRGPRSFSQISVSMSGNYTFSRSPAGVPEPGTWLMWLAGLTAAGMMQRRTLPTATPAQL